MLAETVAQTDGQTLPVFIYRYKEWTDTLYLSVSNVTVYQLHSAAFPVPR